MAGRTGHQMIHLRRAILTPHVRVVGVLNRAVTAAPVACQIRIVLAPKIEAFVVAINLIEFDQSRTLVAPRIRALVRHGISALLASGSDDDFHAIKSA